MSDQRTSKRYAALDAALGLGIVPDVLLRAGSRLAIGTVLNREQAGGVEGVEQRHSALVETKSRGPIAVATEEANEQHYALPPEFLGLFLGKRRKYSGCLWPKGTATIEQAEDEMLALTCARAQIFDGAKVLDLGCGWGAMTLWIAEHYPACHVTAVSNSAQQRGWIESEAKRLGFDDRVEVITQDANDLELSQRFDRVVSVEMFEHLNNWGEMLRRVSTWLEPDGLVFLHVFSHRTVGYLYENSWAAERFFTAGVMPSHDLLMSFQDDLRVRERWAVNGIHYSKTLNAWLQRLDQNRDAALRILEGVYGNRRKAKIALGNWRLFLLSTTEIWGHNKGQDWMVSHYLFEPRA